MKSLLMTTLFSVALFLVPFFSNAADVNQCVLFFSENIVSINRVVETNFELAETDRNTAIQNLLDVARPTTDGFRLEGEQLNIGDVVIVQLDETVYKRDFLRFFKNHYESAEQLHRAIQKHAISGVVVGSRQMYNTVTKRTDLYLAVYDANSKNVFFVTEDMIQENSNSRIVGRDYTKLDSDSVVYEKEKLWVHPADQSKSKH